MDQLRRSRVRPITLGEHVDPFLGGRWLAAFAPVAGTGYVVLVQTPEEVALRPTHVLIGRLTLGFGFVALAVLLMFIGFALWAARRDMAAFKRTYS